MGMGTTVFVVMKIQGDGSLNAREANQQQHSDNEAVALPAFRHFNAWLNTRTPFLLDARTHSRVTKNRSARDCALYGFAVPIA